MGNCQYCGASAGFLRKQHKECASKYNRGIGEIQTLTLIYKAILESGNFEHLENKVKEIAENSWIKPKVLMRRSVFRPASHRRLLYRLDFIYLQRMWVKRLSGRLISV